MAELTVNLTADGQYQIKDGDRDIGKKYKGSEEAFAAKQLLELKRQEQGDRDELDGRAQAQEHEAKRQAAAQEQAEKDRQAAAEQGVREGRGHRETGSSRR